MMAWNRRSNILFYRGTVMITIPLVQAAYSPITSCITQIISSQKVGK